jgi:hypothetical protein
MRNFALSVAAVAMLAAPAAAEAGDLSQLTTRGARSAASGPTLTVPESELAAALTCPIDPTDATRTPLMLVTGTGGLGDETYQFMQPAFEAYGHPVCYVNFPAFTTGDIQRSVEYLVHGLRKEFKMAGRKVAVVGISQGGLLPRFALTYWPDLRRKVSDVLAAAGPQHGVLPPLRIGDRVAPGCSETTPCTPAVWQQLRHSNLLDALNGRPDETPGRVSYTTARSLTDETVRPTAGKHPTSTLEGAQNILIQRLCPTRRTSHIGTLVDSVTFAALTSAVARKGSGKKGAAKPSRFPTDVCDHPYAPGLDEALTAVGLDVGAGLAFDRATADPKVPAEPRVRKVFRRRTRSWLRERRIDDSGERLKRARDHASTRRNTGCESVPALVRDDCCGRPAALIGGEASDRVEKLPNRPTQ